MCEGDFYICTLVGRIDTPYPDSVPSVSGGSEKIATTPRFLIVSNDRTIEVNSPSNKYPNNPP